jgi:hypothetical protein
MDPPSQAGETQLGGLQQGRQIEDPRLAGNHRRYEVADHRRYVSRWVSLQGFLEARIHRFSVLLEVSAH